MGRALGGPVVAVGVLPLGNVVSQWPGDPAEEGHGVAECSEGERNAALGDALVEWRPHHVERQLQQTTTQLQPLTWLQGSTCP